MDGYGRIERKCWSCFMFLRGKTGQDSVPFVQMPLNIIVFCCSSSKLEVPVVPIVAMDRLIPNLRLLDGIKMIQGCLVSTKGQMLPIHTSNTNVMNLAGTHLHLPKKKIKYSTPRPHSSDDYISDYPSDTSLGSRF